MRRAGITAAVAARPEAGNDAVSRHRIPAIDRMMETLAVIERRGSRVSIRDLVETIGLPRTTIYRILNSLQSHQMVRRSLDGTYSLGPRLVALAARVVDDAVAYDLPAAAMPHLERLSAELGEASKVSILHKDGVLVIAAVQGAGDYALNVVAGQQQPLHAGAASKVLLASLPLDELARLLPEPLAIYTPLTLSNRKRLLAELVRIRRQGWAADKGEYGSSIRAFAAPIKDAGGRVSAALSVPFLAGASTARMEAIKAAVLATAARVGAATSAR